MRVRAILLTLVFAAGCGSPESTGVQLGTRLRIVNEGAMRVAFTGFVVGPAGAAEPCYYGMIGVDHRLASTDIDPPAGKTLRLRFAAVEGTDFVLGKVKLADETAVAAVAAAIPEIDASDGHAEYLFSGGSAVLRVVANGGRVVVKAD